MALVTMGTGGHYITMLPADWSTSISHNLFALRFCIVKMLRNLHVSIGLICLSSLGLAKYYIDSSDILLYWIASLILDQLWNVARCFLTHHFCPSSLVQRPMNLAILLVWCLAMYILGHHRVTQIDARNLDSLLGTFCVRYIVKVLLQAQRLCHSSYKAVKASLITCYHCCVYVWVCAYRTCQNWLVSPGLSNHLVGTDYSVFIKFESP